MNDYWIPEENAMSEGKWRRGADVVRMWNHVDRDSKSNFEIAFNGVIVEEMDSYCKAREELFVRFGIIPEGSVWQHEVTGNRFIVTHSNPQALEEDDPDYPPDLSEPWVRVRSLSYVEYENVWLARRIFDNDRFLRLIDSGF